MNDWLKEATAITWTPVVNAHAITAIHPRTDLDVRLVAGWIAAKTDEARQIAGTIDDGWWWTSSRTPSRVRQAIWDSVCRQARGQDPAFTDAEREAIAADGKLIEKYTGDQHG